MAEQPIPRDEPRSHLTGPIRTHPAAERRGPSEEQLAHAEALEWLVDTVLLEVQERMGTGPRYGTRHLPITAVSAFPTETDDGGLEFEVTLGGFTFCVAVERADPAP